MKTDNDRSARVRVSRTRDERPMYFGVARPACLNAAPAGELAARSTLAQVLRRNPPCGEGLCLPGARKRKFCAQGQAEFCQINVLGRSYMWKELLRRCTSHERTTAWRSLVSALLIAVMAIPGAAAAAATVSSVPVSTVDPGVPKPASRNLSTKDRITRLEAATRTNPSDGDQWRQLGAAYVRRAYETADPAFYPLAESALKQAEKHLGSTPELIGTKATLALARHRFQDARSLATEVVRQRPGGLDGRIALFDADVELGNYERAFAQIESLVDERPNVATLSRLSYRRQLTGDLLGAEIAMRQAASAAPAGSIDRAIALAYLGDVLLESGHLAAAARTYEQTLRIEPTNGTAMLGSARVAVARGDASAAALILDRLVERIPLPGALGLRADLARASGDLKAATANDQLVDASVALFEASGSVVDAELAILLADRGSGSSAAALRAARRAYAERRTVFTNDAMAWSLFVSGRPVEAVPYARAAVASGPGVSSVRWHAAEVFAATGDLIAARRETKAALRNPWSSPLQLRALRSLADRLDVDAPSLAAPAPVRTPPATTPSTRSS